MRARRAIFRAFLAVAAAVTLAAGPTASRAAEPPLRLGVAGPMSGPYAAFGTQLRQGVELAVAQLNAAGGILGRRVALEVLDDRCDPAEAAAVAERAVRRRLVLVVGHFCSSASLAAAPIYRDRRILMITPASTNPLLTEQGNPFVFRVVSRDDRQGVAAARHVRGRLPGRRVAVLDDGSAYGRGMADAFAAELRRRGPLPVARLSLATAADPVASLRRARANLLYVGGFAEPTADLLAALDAAGLRPVVIGPDALASASFLDRAGDLAEGVRLTFEPDARERRSARKAVAAFRARGIEPEGYVLHAYAAVQVWAEAAARAQDTAPSRVAARLRGNSFASVLGRLAFDAKGDLRRDRLAVFRWQDGELVQLR